MPSFVTWEIFPIGARVVNDNERSQRFGYSGIVKSHELRQPKVRHCGTMRRGIVVMYDRGPNKKDCTLSEQQYLCDVEQGLVLKTKEYGVSPMKAVQLSVIEMLGIENENLKGQVSALNATCQKAEGYIASIQADRDQLIDSRNDLQKDKDFLAGVVNDLRAQLQKERSRVHELKVADALLRSINDQRVALLKSRNRNPEVAKLDKMDEVGKFAIIIFAPDDVMFKTQRLAQEHAKTASRNKPTNTYSIVRVLSEIEQVFSTQTKVTQL